jgi:hypothetical protein
MALPVHHKRLETELNCASPSIGASPVSAVVIATNSGFISRILCAPGGTTTGTIQIACSVNNGADILNGNLTVAAGTGARAGSVYEFPAYSPASPRTFVNEGDLIVLTPSLGGGASIPGAFGVVVQKTGG